MDTSGSIRASGIGRGYTSYRPAPIDNDLLSEAREFIDSYQFDFRIRQPLFEEKIAQTIGKHIYYVLGNEQKFEPGFLVCMVNKPIIFINSRFQYGFHLRLRLHTSIQQKGAIFQATLDTVHSTLRIEDVLFYCGECQFQHPYSKRYQVLQNFYENAFVQDLRLSTVRVFLAEPKPLSSFKEEVESNQYNSIDLIPEQGGRRRWNISLVVKERAPAPFVPDLPTSRSTLLDTKPNRAKAVKVAGLPDTFDLFVNEESIGRAAIQSLDVSIKLRGMKEANVSVDWEEEFHRYKITGLA